jgi:acetyltransferase
MSVRNLDKLCNPRSVALFGVGSRLGSVVARNLSRSGFSGELMRVDEAATGLPRAPELAVITAPAETVPPLIAELGKAGTRAAVLVSAGFSELGQQATLAAAKPHLLRIVGPSCLGIMVPRLGLDASFSHLAAPAGDLAFVSQSGAMITAMLDWAVPRGIGFSHVVSLGDMADVDFGDMLDYLAADAHTRAILLYVEGITHGRKFMSAARAASRIKPVLVLKAGRSDAGARAAVSHTGARAGADAAYDAAFRRAGMLRVETMAELFDAAETLALTREQVGERLAILTNSGGVGVLATDALVAAGGWLAELSPGSRSNPVDLGGDAPATAYAEALTALIGEPEVDAILVLNCPTALAQPEEAAAAVIDALGAATPGVVRDRNVITAWLGEHSARAARRLFAKARIATFETPESAVGAFMHRVRHRRNRELLMETPPSRALAFEADPQAVRRVIAEALAAGKTWRDALATGAVLAAYGVPLAAGDPSVARRGAVELRAGLVYDPVFGPLVLFGQGGAAVEGVGDTALELPPLNALLAKRLMARTRVWRLLQGYRGQPAATIEAVIEVLIRIGQLAIDHPEVRELDISPLLADAAGVIARDARMRIAPFSGPSAARLAIAPYPQHLETGERLRDGTSLRLRPLRPEDEPMLLDLAAHMSREDLRLRFFTPVSGLTHAVAARLSQLDYDRELALLAERDGVALGVAHFFADPDNLRAEYAIAVRSDWKGRGVGYLLMERLIDIARRRGIGELVGEVLRENRSMLQMCRELGFMIARQPADPTIVLVGKKLAENG